MPEGSQVHGGPRAQAAAYGGSRSHATLLTILGDQSPNIVGVMRAKRRLGNAGEENRDRRPRTRDCAQVARRWRAGGAQVARRWRTGGAR